jgi:hypothetical protein
MDMDKKSDSSKDGCSCGRDGHNEVGGGRGGGGRIMWPLLPPPPPSRSPTSQIEYVSMNVTHQTLAFDSLHEHESYSHALLDEN